MKALDIALMDTVNVLMTTTDINNEILEIHLEEINAINESREIQDILKTEVQDLATTAVTINPEVPCIILSIKRTEIQFCPGSARQKTIQPRNFTVRRTSPPTLGSASLLGEKINEKGKRW